MYATGRGEGINQNSYVVKKKISFTGLARNKLPISEGPRMRSIRPNKMKFELRIIEMMRLTFI